MRHWLLLAAMTAVSSTVFTVLRLPTPLLFGGLLGGLAYALARSDAPLVLPEVSFQAGQAVIGVVVGAAIDWSSLVSLGPRWPVVAVISSFTIVVSVLAGRPLMRHGVSRATATFGSVAGGAAGLTAMADDLGADSRVVAVLQYLRLLAVLVTLPVVVLILAGSHSGRSPVADGPGWAINLAFAALAALAGLLLARIVRVPSAAILGPLVVAALIALLPVFDGAGVPAVVSGAGYAVIGVQVGLRFTPASLRSISRLVPTALAMTAITLLTCAGLGWVLAVTTDASALDAYLATTPGGIYAVLGTATATGSDVTFVTAAQAIRLLVVLLGAPVLAAYLKRLERRSSS